MTPPDVDRCVAERWVLEPCPFCGHPPKVDEYNPYGGDSRWTAVACYAPECGEVAFRAPTEAEAIAAWNRRALRQGGEHRLWDSQWVNVVNHDNCYRDYTKEEAVAKAVRLTEQYMAENMTQGFPPAPPSPAKEG